MYSSLDSYAKFSKAVNQHRSNLHFLLFSSSFFSRPSSTTQQATAIIFTQNCSIFSGAVHWPFGFLSTATISAIYTGYIKNSTLTSKVQKNTMLSTPFYFQSIRGVVNFCVMELTFMTQYIITATSTPSKPTDGSFSSGSITYCDLFAAPNMQWFINASASQHSIFGS